MFQLSIECEDFRINAMSLDGQVWRTTFIDTAEVVIETVECVSREELAAIVNLGLFSVGEENSPGYDAAILQAKAETVLAGTDMERESWPIP